MNQMTWAKLLSRKRAGVVQIEQHEVGRSHFQKDIDRIIFSSAFRRLNHKTQVHPLPDNDNIHTRLPHSLEASSVGRSLGTKVGKKLVDEFKEIGIEPSDLGDIVQAACLAHDIGNPPFGHSGEDAIGQWFRKNFDREPLQELTAAELTDFQNFEGNAQGLRIITKLEYYLFEGGMRLTQATLGTFLKYPWTSDLITSGKHKKYGCNQSEREILTEIATELGLIQHSKTAWCRHPLAYLMEAADDICYASIDLEDGIEMGFLTYDETIDILKIIVDFDKIPPLHASCEGNELRGRQIAIARGRAINMSIEGVVNAFVERKDDLLNGELRYEDLIGACGGRVQEFIQTAKDAARTKIFDHPRKIQLEIGSHRTIETLLAPFIDATYALHSRTDGDDLAARHTRILDLMGSHQPKQDWPLYQAYLHVLDFISGMTDKYAVNIADRIAAMKK